MKQSTRFLSVSLFVFVYALASCGRSDSKGSGGSSAGQSVKAASATADVVAEEKFVEMEGHEEFSLASLPYSATLESKESFEKSNSKVSNFLCYFTFGTCKKLLKTRDSRFVILLS